MINLYVCVMLRIEAGLTYSTLPYCITFIMRVIKKIHLTYFDVLISCNEDDLWIFSTLNFLLIN